ncbi:tetratricopeptide repeat protein [Streptomyces sp. NPDC127108]|uniref:tetratricopeptide repeat protein n=1 Tax=Streptomyces sp. NPDC127108 TaxID=3345361 RepID=UPI003640B877
MSNTISGGVFFHAVIQGRDITVVLPPQITPALSGLPPVSRTFTGREQPVEDLLQALAPGCPEQRAVLVTAVAGLAGVGKTELVVQCAARALKEPGWFPGGVLFVDMFGYDTKRHLSPERALDGMLRALGMPGEHVPADLQDRSRLYRSVLAAFAEQDRRILLVIDNASTAEQARPLLPTDGTTATLLTSRHTLDIDARLHDLDTLDPDASVELLRQVLLQARGTADTRVQDAPEHAATIARLCAGLPLALRIAAALLADTPTRPLASLAQALETEHTRLERLRREDRAVRSAFDLSYQRLGPDHGRLFRLLPLNAGPDVSTESAAHLADTDPPQTEELLQDLARAHLIEPGPAWGRWRLHDLIRLYADHRGHAQTDTDHRDAAITRLSEHYLSVAKAADTHLETLPHPTSARFPDRRQALAWLDSEHLNLVAAASAGLSLSHLKTSARLALTIGRYLYQRRHFDDLITVSQSALAASQQLGDHHREGGALNHLGLALTLVRRFEEAIDAHTRAATIFRAFPDRLEEASALNGLGLALNGVRRFEEAIDAHTRAADALRELGDQHSEGTALTNLGLALGEMRRFDEAIDAHTRAATIFRGLDDRHHECAVLNNLGMALASVGRFEEAIDAHTRASDVLRELGDHFGEGRTLNNLGSALAEVRRFDEAIDAHTRAADILRELGDHHGEGDSLNNLGLALTRVHRIEEAIDAHTRAATIYRELGDHHSESTAVTNLAIVFGDVGRLEEAIDANTQAAAIFRKTGDHHGEGPALGRLGLALHRVGRLEEAIDANTRAVVIFQEVGDHHSEGAALNNLGAALQRVGRLEEAIDVLTRAATIHRELGDHQEESGAQTNLDAALRQVRRSNNS